MILLLLSFLRTVVPAIVGAVVAVLVQSGLTVDPEFEGALTAVLFATFTGLYYLVIRVIEMKFPWVGVLIGWAASPDSYSKGPGVDITKPTNELIVTVNQEKSPITPIEGTVLPNLNSSTVSNLDRVPGPDHAKE